MHRVLISLLLLALLQGALAYAMLGPAPPVLFQQRQQRAAGAALYAIHVSAEDGGGVLRRYASSDGAVFAVRWDCPYMPDLATVLAAHRDNRQAPPMVVVAGGKAWIPAALPAGFNTDSDL
ncbi:DUF2844 domain-containing protein [Oxalobacteraceae bacterium A2-2]